MKMIVSIAVMSLAVFAGTGRGEAPVDLGCVEGCNPLSAEGNYMSPRNNPLGKYNNPLGKYRNPLGKYSNPYIQDGSIHEYAMPNGTIHEYAVDEEETYLEESDEGEEDDYPGWSADSYQRNQRRWERIMERVGK